jgi:hypothetical protein
MTTIATAGWNVPTMLMPPGPREEGRRIEAWQQRVGAWSPLALPPQPRRPLPLLDVLKQVGAAHPCH